MKSLRRDILLVFVAAGALFGACSDSTSPAEHRQAACDGFNTILERASTGGPQPKSTLDDAVENARASENDKLEEAFTRWRESIEAGSTTQTDAAAVEIADLCA